jgi:hypothetical protein
VVVVDVVRMEDAVAVLLVAVGVETDVVGKDGVVDEVNGV